jgi:Spy/CpxP family protein refolding chaperone
MLNRSRLWAMTLLLAVFAAGLAMGGLTWNMLTDGQSTEPVRRGNTEQRDREHRSYSEHLQEALNLTLEQRAAVDSILDEGQSEMREVWRQMRSRIDTLRQEVSNDVMRLLDEEQQTKYRDLIASSNRRGDRERVPRNN